MKVWLNGSLAEAEAARIDPADRGFTLGDGLYETLAVRGGRADHLPAHLDRLREGCRVLRLPYPDIDVETAIRELAAANGHGDAAIRITYTRGPGARGLPPPPTLRPTLLITTAPLPGETPPLRVIVARGTRRNERSPLSRCKTLNCLDSLLARLEAADAGADDAILLNTEGRVSEATSANVFAVIDGQLVTPPVEDGALPGVRRAAFLDDAVVRPLTEADLRRASRIFLTTCLAVREVAELAAT